MSVRNGNHPNTRKALCIVPVGSIARHMSIYQTLRELLEENMDNQVVLISSRLRVRNQSVTMKHHRIPHLESILFSEENLYSQVLGALTTMHGQNKQITFVVSSTQSALLKWIVKHLCRKIPGKEVQIHVMDVESTLMQRLWSMIEYLLDVSRGFPAYSAKHK